MRLPWWIPLGTVPEVAPAELERRLAAGEPLQIVDVRTGLEYEGGHLAGAVHLPITRFGPGWRALGLDPQAPVVAICLSAHRSIPAVRRLRAEGFDACQLAGGMLAWRRAGLSEVNGRAPGRRS